MKRNKHTHKRITIKDDCGMIGFSSVNLEDRSCILVEGVSDFITMKLAFPTRNIIGMTTLSGNNFAKTFVSSMFDNITIMSDNDFSSARNTGILASQRMREYYTSLGKQVRVELPDVSYKDITDQFIHEYKYSK